jgi:hypothetical protein
MKLNTKSVGKATLIRLCLVFGLLLIIPLLGWPWHLINGGSLESSGVIFKVPSRYFSLDSTDDHPSMMRCGIGFPFWRARYGFMGLHPHPKRHKLDMKVDLDRLLTILVNQERAEGMSLIAQRTVETEIGPAFCFEFRSGARSIIDCYFDGSTLSLDYEGSEKFAGDIYELVNSARWQGNGPIGPPGMALLENYPAPRP